MAKNRASSIAISRVLSEDDINRVKNQFEDDCTGTYDEAINRHRNISTSHVPMWMYIALLWYSSDNIWGYMQSPIMFYPIIILLGAFFMIVQLGLLPILQNVGVPAAK